MNTINKSNKYSHLSPKTKVIRRDNFQAIDFFMAIINFGVIFTVITFLSFNNVILYIIELGFSLIVLGSMLFTFFKKNPYYPYFCYGLVLCGTFYALPLMIFSPFDTVLGGAFLAFGIILFLPELWYIYNLTKGYGSVTFPIRGYKLYQNIGAGTYFDESRMKEYLNEKHLQLKIKEEEKQKELKKKFKANWIIFVSISYIIGFFITAIISVMI